jgi:hypothetical protein
MGKVAQHLHPRQVETQKQVVHPTIGETISSCKKLMHNPAMRKIWQMAFGTDFGGMAQGDNKTGQNRSNSILS